MFILFSDIPIRRKNTINVLRKKIVLQMLSMQRRKNAGKEEKGFTCKHIEQKSLFLFFPRTNCSLTKQTAISHTQEINAEGSSYIFIGMKI